MEVDCTAFSAGTKLDLLAAGPVVSPNLDAGFAVDTLGVNCTAFRVVGVDDPMATDPVYLLA